MRDSMVQFMQLPSNSRDINVIEILLSVLKREVNMLPIHWTWEAKVQYIMEHKIENDFLTKCGVNAINLFGQYLRSTLQGYLLDSQADRIVQALLRRVGADRSTKFLYNESLAAIHSISRALSPAVIVNLLCRLVLEQKAKSAQTRVAVSEILHQRIEAITQDGEDLDNFMRQCTAEGLERLIKMFIATHGREIFRLMSTIKGIRELCRQKLTDRVWRAIQPLLQVHEYVHLKN
ncbi:unnamed protein product [Echinostoma caproni]|uniref:DUF3677 domain-containing protein n=1 Tax=Echinostoma caproni TaxID=27848 RepID=A0A183AFC8_9TREM|nr:unnamed protein product [Echinostoma caproni]